MCPLRHCNLVRLWGGVWNEGVDRLCIVLELCHNGSLKAYLLHREVESWSGFRAGLALGSAKGLRYLHHEFQEPLIHRDIKVSFHRDPMCGANSPFPLPSVPRASSLRYSVLVSLTTNSAAMRTC